MQHTVTRLLALLLATALVACGQAPSVLSTVQILGGDRTVPVGTQLLLTPLVSVPGDAATTVTWSSSDDEVATVTAGGLVTAHMAGAASITATSTFDADIDDTITVTVTPDAGAAFRVEGTASVFEDAAPPIGVALVLIDDMPLNVLSSSVIEIFDGGYLGPVSPVAADGSFTLVLPPGADIPQTVFAPADDFVTLLRSVDACGLEASDASVAVTALFSQFELWHMPSIAVITADGFQIAFNTDALIETGGEGEPDLQDFRYLVWVYAQSAVDVTSTGAGCDEGGFVYGVDVSLEAGWNQLGWSLSYDEIADDFTGMTLGNSDDDVYVLGFPGF